MNSLIRNVKTLNIPAIKYISKKVTPSLSSIEHVSTNVSSRDSRSHYQRSKSLPPILQTFKSIDIPYKIKVPQDVSPFRARINPGLTRPTFKVFSKRFFSWKTGKTKVKSKITENRIDKKRGRGVIRDTCYNTPCIKPKDDKKTYKSMLLGEILSQDQTKAGNSRTVRLLRSISGPSTSIQEKLAPSNNETIKSQVNTIKDILNLNDEIKAKKLKDNITITHCKNKVTFHYLAPRSDCRQCESKNSKRVFDFYQKNVPKIGKYSQKNRFFSSYCKQPKTPTTEETQPVKKETIIVKDQNLMENIAQNKSISLFNLIKYRTSLSSEFFPTNQYKFEAKQRPDIYQFQEDKTKEKYDPYPLEMFTEDVPNWSLDTAKSMQSKQASSFFEDQFKPVDDDYVMLNIPDAANNLEFDCRGVCPDCGTGEKRAPCKIKAPKKKKDKRETNERCRKPVKETPCNKKSPCDQDWGGSRLSPPDQPEQTLLEGTTVKGYDLGGCRDCNKGLRQCPSKRPKKNDPKRDQRPRIRPGKSKKGAGRKLEFDSLPSVTASNYFSGDILNKRNFVESPKKTTSDHHFLNICQTERVDFDNKPLPKFFVHPKDDLSETINQAFELPPKVEISEKSKEMLANAIRKMIQPVIETEFLKYDEVKAAVERMEQNLESCIKTLSKALQTPTVSPLSLTNRQSEKPNVMKLKYPWAQHSETHIIERSLNPEIKDPFKTKWEHRDPRNVSSIGIPSTEQRISYKDPETDNNTDQALSKILANQKPFREIKGVISETQSNFRNLDSQSKINHLMKKSQMLCSGKDPCNKNEDPCKKKEDPCKKTDKVDKDPYNCVKEKKSNSKPESVCKEKEDPCKKKEDPCKKKEDPCKKKEDPCKKEEDPCKKAYDSFTPIETCRVDPCNSPCKKEEPPCKPAMESVKCPSNQSADSCGNMTKFEVTCKKSKAIERECCQPPVTCDESNFKRSEIKCGSTTVPKIRQPPMSRSCEATDDCKSVPMPENCPLKPDCNQGCPEGKPVSCYQTACKIRKETSENTNAKDTCRDEINVERGMAGMKELRKCDYTKNVPCASCEPKEKPETFIQISPEQDVENKPCVKLRECPEPTEKEKRYCNPNAFKKEEEEELARIKAVEDARKKELEMECKKPIVFGESSKNNWSPVKIENKNMSDSKTLPQAADSKPKEKQLRSGQESAKSKGLVENCSNKISDLCMMIVRKHKGGKKAAPIIVTLSRSQPNLDNFSGHGASPLMCPGGSSHGSGGNGNKKNCAPFGFFKGNKKSNSTKKSSEEEKFLKMRDDCKKNGGNEKKAKSNNSCTTNQVKSEPCIPCKYEDYSKKQVQTCNNKNNEPPKKNSCAKEKEDPCKKKEDPCKKTDKVDKDPYNCVKEKKLNSKAESVCKEKEDPCKKKDHPGKKKDDPCKPKEDPCKKKEDPCKKKEDPCKKKEDPSKKKEDPCKKKEDDPCKKKEDPPKKQEKKCTTKDDPCKKKEDPCKKEEKLCQTNEVPAKKVEDPCKKSSSKKECKTPLNKPTKKIICTSPKSKFRNKYPWNDPELTSKQSKRQCDKVKEAKSSQDKKCADKEQKSDPCMEKTQKVCRKQQGILKKFNSLDNTKAEPQTNSLSCLPDKNKQMDCKKKDSCNKQEDPCKKKEDPCKKKEDPCKKGDDPCQKNSSKPKKKCKNLTNDSDLRLKIQSPSVQCSAMENRQGAVGRKVSSFQGKALTRHRYPWNMRQKK